MKHVLFSKYEIGDTVYLNGPCEELKCTIVDICFRNGVFMYLLDKIPNYVNEIEIRGINDSYGGE